PVNVSGEMFHALRERLGPDLTLAAMGGSMAVNLRNGTHAAHVTMGRVSREYFDVVAIQPRFGRAFTGDEDSAGGAAAVVIADELWRTELGGRPDAVGTTLYLDGKPHTVVGIMPPEFRSFPGARLWGPLQLSPQDQGLNYLLLTR